jgi:hypothetical protein
MEVLFASIFPIREFEVSQDDDIHVIEKVKGCLLPWFCCKQTHHHCPIRMQIDMPTTNGRPNPSYPDACQ